MNNKTNEITERDHWEGFHKTQPRLRLPSRLVITTRNIQGLLKDNIAAGDQVLEIGFAPGKQLSYVAANYQATVSGVDYSEHGIETAQRLFSALNIEADIRCESIFETSFSPSSFDFVYSIGVVEHFKDPTEVIQKHIGLLKPGGKAIIAIPNYGGIYGRVQSWFDQSNIDIHNLDMMSESAFAAFINADDVAEVKAYSYGRFDPSIISWRAKFPAIIAKMFNYAGTFIGHLLPSRLGFASPWLILEVRR